MHDQAVQEHKISQPHQLDVVANLLVNRLGKMLAQLSAFEAAEKCTCDDYANILQYFKQHSFTATSCNLQSAHNSSSLKTRPCRHPDGSNSLASQSRQGKNLRKGRMVNGDKSQEHTLEGGCRVADKSWPALVEQRADWLRSEAQQKWKTLKSREVKSTFYAVKDNGVVRKSISPSERRFFINLKKHMVPIEHGKECSSGINTLQNMIRLLIQCPSYREAGKQLRVAAGPQIVKHRDICMRILLGLSGSQSRCFVESLVSVQGTRLQSQNGSFIIYWPHNLCNVGPDMVKLLKLLKSVPNTTAYGHLKHIIEINHWIYMIHKTLLFYEFEEFAGNTLFKEWRNNMTHTTTGLFWCRLAHAMLYNKGSSVLVIAKRSKQAFPSVKF